MDIGVGAFEGEADRHRAGARSEIEDAWPLDTMQMVQGELNQQFGFWARNQRVRRNAEAAAVEFASAEDVCDGFASCAPIQRLTTSG